MGRVVRAEQGVESASAPVCLLHPLVPRRANCASCDVPSAEERGPVAWTCMRCEQDYWHGSPEDGCDGCGFHQEVQP